jgi:hypothetical protein
MPLIIGGIAIAAASVTAGVVLTRSHGDDTEHVANAPPPVEPPPKPTAAMPAPPPPPSPTTGAVDVDIRVTPSNASVTIDGVHMPANPFHSKFLSDTAIHQVSVTAPGYLPKTTTITYTANVTLELSLEHIASPTRVVVVHAPPTTPQIRQETPATIAVPIPVPTPTPPPRVDVVPVKPATPTDINPAGGIKPRRPIDATNPYGAK